MSYLNTPRICFHGTCRFAGPTQNNLLAALDYPAILGQKPGWDYFADANSDFRLESGQVTAAWDAKGTLIVDPDDDDLIGAAAVAAGKMADLDPEHRRVTDLIGMALAITLPDAGTGGPPVSLSGTLELTQLRDYWSNPASVTVTAWQSVILEPNWSTGFERSAVLKQLYDAHGDGLSVRLTPIAQPDPTFTGRLLGVIGPWSQDEPKQFVAARRLITRRPAGLLPFPVASCLVDAGRQKLVADLGNLPLSPIKPLTDPLITNLVASILKGDSEGGGVWTDLGASRDLTAGQWLATAGIVEWDLTPGQLSLLAGHRLRFAFYLDGELLVMQEHPSGCYVDVDRRSLRLDPGDSEPVDIYATRLGKPLEGLVVNFSLEQQKAIAAVETILQPPGCPPTPTMFGYPTDPNRLINSEPRDVLLDRPGPLQAVTDANGYAQLTVTARPGTINLPASRVTIDSQLYFLGEPDGWQTWGAIGPNNGDLDSHRVGAGCALAVLVFNTRDLKPQPTWEDIEPWMSQYALLYPVMGNPPINLDLGDKDQVDQNAFIIYERLACKGFNDVQRMPITRDLSGYRRQTILAYLRSVIQGPLPC